MAGTDTAVSVNPTGPGSLADVSAAHDAAKNQPLGSRGRPPAPPSGDPVRDARRVADREAYRRKNNLPAPTNQNNVSVGHLYRPETCVAIVQLPFHITGYVLKSDSWALDKDEVEMLAPPCAETLNAWFPEASPKWAALTALAMAMLTVTAKKFLIYQEEVRIERERAQAEK